jgi:integrase
LSDEEIRKVWNAAEGNYGRLVRFALLIAQRFAKVTHIRWEDIDGNVWTIPSTKRGKGTGEVLKLPPLAMEMLGKRGEGLVFPTPWGKAFSNGRDKAKLDAMSGVTGWRFHDLRRTARSLMSRAGVRPDIAERVLGHAVPGVGGIYDRHSYDAEKADALAKLAGLLSLILNPPANNVVGMGRRTA